MFRLGAILIILTLLLPPLPARAELWLCHQEDGSYLFTDQVQDPSTCQKYETAPGNVMPTASTTTPPPEAAAPKPKFTQEELDQMLAPIALYPDALLSQILMASTYPLEVVEAARWSKANSQLKGEQAVHAVTQNAWDPSVKSLVAFPQILHMMDEHLSWTERLGDAFLAQQAQVMDTIQNLRQKAYEAGNLKSSDQVRVEQQGQTIVIEQPNPQVVYVPYYDPWMVYGPWWWPAYPPVYWAPWPGFFVSPGITVGFAWGPGIRVGAGFFFGACNWPRRHVTVVNVNNFYFNKTVTRNQTTVNQVNAWQHDPVHRRGVPYRETSLRQQFGRMSASPPETRQAFRGHDPSSLQGSGTFNVRPPARSTPDGSRSDMQSTPNRQTVPDAGRSMTPSRPSAPNGGGSPPGRANVPDGSRSDMQSTPNRQTVPDAGRSMTPSTPSRPSAPSGGGSPPSRFNAPPQSRSDIPSMPSRPSAPSIVSPPPVQQRSHAFEGLGRGGDVRSFSERGHASVAPRSSGGAPSSGGSRSSGNSSGSSQSGQGKSSR
jgi:hypothetical protein